MTGVAWGGLVTAVTLYGVVPPVTRNWNVFPAHVTVGACAVGVMTSAVGVGGVGGVGTVAVPKMLLSCAVVCRPTESTIVNTFGSTQVPLVTASKNPPDALTVELTSATAFGNVDATW